MLILMNPNYTNNYTRGVICPFFSWISGFFCKLQCCPPDFKDLTDKGK